MPKQVNIKIDIKKNPLRIGAGEMAEDIEMVLADFFDNQDIEVTCQIKIT